MWDIVVVEAFPRLVPGPDFKSGGGRGDTASAGSIPVRFRRLEREVQWLRRS